MCAGVRTLHMIQTCPLQVSWLCSPMRHGARWYAQYTVFWMAHPHICSRRLFWWMTAVTEVINSLSFAACHCSYSETSWLKCMWFYVETECVCVVVMLETLIQYVVSSNLRWDTICEVSCGLPQFFMQMLGVVPRIKYDWLLSSKSFQLFCYPAVQRYTVSLVTVWWSNPWKTVWI